VALLDQDEKLHGEQIAGLSVQPMDCLGALVREQRLAIGVIATPAASAQGVCDQLVAAGVRSILNFAPCVLVVPDDVDVRKVDLSTELQILAFHEQRKALAAGAGFDSVAQVVNR
jgi:redox-sensing transcriptional repressor